MKNLFISYHCDSGFKNLVLTGDDAKLSTENDIKTIEQYIELKNNYHEVKIINFRRME